MPGTPGPSLVPVPLPPDADAPGFALPSADGQPRSLDDLTTNGAVLLAFFKTGCPTCQLAFPVYGELERRYGDAVPVVAVTQDPLATTVPWLEEKGFAGPVLDDDSDGYAVSAAYGVTTVPTLVMVEVGTVVVSSEGWDRDRVNAWAAVLAERAGGDATLVSTEGDGLPVFKPG